MQKSRVRLKKDGDASVCPDTSETVIAEHIGEGEGLGDSSRGDLCESESGTDGQCTSEGTPLDIERIRDRAVYEAYLSGLQMPLFIFHAAGHCGKLECLKGVMQKRGMQVPAEFLALSDFKISKGDRTVTTSYPPPR
jgi:hypothetical protein